MSTNEHSEYVPLDPDTGFSLNSEFVDEVVQAIARGDRTTARALVYPLPAPDQAELFDQIDQTQRHWLTDVLSAEFDSETLAEMSPEAAEDVLEALGAEKSAEVLADMETDDAVHILEDLSHEAQQEILEEMPADVREEVEESMAFPLESAGRLMRHALVAVPESWTVGDTIDYLRSNEELPENFYVIYAVDGEFRPTGRILLGNILSHKRTVKLASLLPESNFAIHTHTDQEEVAHLFRKYALVEAPVVNETGTLVGTITVDDVVDVIQEEEEEDYLAAGGVSVSDFGSRIGDAVRARFGWLFLNVWTAALAATVISQFQDSIEKLVALAVVMPIVSAMGGNTGTQAVTVAVRAIATKHLTEANRWSYVRKEAFIGLINGSALGLIMALGAYFWFRDLPFAGVLFAASTITMTAAGLFGALIPITLDQRGIDPAISSSIFLTTVTDCLGFFSFLGLATVVLL